MNAHYQLLQNQHTQASFDAIDASNLPDAMKIILKNNAAQVHMINSTAFHFVEHNNRGLLSPFTNIESTFNINFFNLNQAVNLGVAVQTNLGEMWALQIGPFTSLLRMDQAIAMQRVPKESLPQNIQMRGIDNVINQISEIRGVSTCFQGVCGGSNLQCVWLEVPLNGPNASPVYGAVIVCRTHAPSYQENGQLNILAGQSSTSAERWK